MMDHFRYCITTCIYYPLVYAAIIMGHKWPLAVMLFITVSQVLVDGLTPPDRKVVTIKHRPLLDLYLYLHLPLGFGMLLLMSWHVAPGDLWGIGAWLSGLLGPWVIEAHANHSVVDHIILGLYVGFVLSTGTLVGHELVHRLSSPLAVLAGRWLLAMNFDAQFSISHVYGHHRNVGTPKDPATARRGEPLYRFVLRSTIGQYREAWEIERERLAKKELPRWSFYNRLLTGVAMSMLIAVFCYALGGWIGVGLFMLAACLSKCMFEMVNYIQHYGLVRVPGTRVEPRHSWDCISRACTNTFFALPRHAHHHAKPGLAYWQLEPSSLAATELINKGYMATMFIAMLPSLWFHVTSLMLLRWDKEYATEEELRLANDANRESGIKALTQASGELANSA
ncbi:MAG: alkane 1-monooxygenase [Gammaproteobacteria bacterium]